MLATMALQLMSLCVDAKDPGVMARFWAEALRWEVGHATDDWATVMPTDGTRFRLGVLRNAEAKPGPHRIHLDLTTTSLEDQRDSVARLLELGGRHLDVGQGLDATHVVLADPEGNELCLIEPGNSFLASCGRLGALSGDGTREVGYFWSAALDWPLVWDQDEETAIQAPDGTGPKLSWGGPPVAPKRGKNRWHLDVAPVDGAEQQAEVDRLIALGAAPVDIGQGDVDWVVLVDPDGNEFCVLSGG